MKWKRKRDGVIVTTRVRYWYEQSHKSVNVRRDDNGHLFWATWQGMEKKYELLSPVSTTGREQ